MMKQFHSFRLDPANLCLWRGDEQITLRPKAFDLLRYLVEHADRLVTHDEILEALWAGTYVNPEVVKKYIMEVRKALGDRPGARAFIETVPRRGYRFVAPVWESGSPASSSSVTAATTVVGRATSRARLTSGFDKALLGHRQVVFVTGEAGVGKTTLADVFQQHVAENPKARIAWGQCVEGFGGKEAYYPLLEALGQLIRGRGGPAVVQVLAERAPTWLVQFPSLVKPEQREALQKDLLGTTRERMVREICEALEALTAESPLVLVLEDLHWVDLSTLDVVSALARRRGPAMLMVLCTYRPADVAGESPLRGLKQDLLVHRLCEEIALARLEKVEVGEYLAAEFPSADLPSSLASLIHRHSGGNPLFMVAIVQDMVKRALIAQDQGAWRLAVPLEDLAPAVPETLQQMLEVQFGQLSEVEQRTLERASVAGERFSAWTITTASDVSPEHVERTCEGLADRQQFIRSVGFQQLADESAVACYEFRHSLYRQMVYERLSEAHRSRLHRAIGERLKGLCTPGQQELAGELAAHFEMGRDYRQAVEYLILAADNAVRRFAYREAVQPLDHALALVPRCPAATQVSLEILLQERLGDTHYWFGAMHASARAYESEAARAAAAGLEAARVHALSCLVRPFGLIDPDRGIAAMEEAERLAAGLGDPLQQAHIRLLAAGSRLLYDKWRTNDRDTCASAREAIHRLTGAELPAYPRVIYAHVQLLQGEYTDALRNLDPGMPTMSEPASLMAYFFELSGRTLALLHSGQFGELVQIIRAGTAMAEKNGSDPWLFSYREAWLRTVIQDFAGARQLCETLTGATTREHSHVQPRTIARLAAGYADIERGRYDDAIQQFHAVLNPEVTPKFFLHWYWRMNAQLGLCNACLAAGNLGQARKEADCFLESACATGEPNLQAFAWEAQARLEMAGQNWTAAADKIQRGLAIVEAFTIPTAAWQVHATFSDLSRHVKDGAATERHRARAEAIILSLAGSFSPDDPLRALFLRAPGVRRIRGAETESKAARDGGSRTRARHHGRPGPRRPARQGSERPPKRLV
jgi:DNA-binding winged helix-turn-helix (wHTH) protein/tetratricopeptide (TPR) repeat protein